LIRLRRAVQIVAATALIYAALAWFMVFWTNG
jgi:hypothetical protein